MGSASPVRAMTEQKHGTKKKRKSEDLQFPKAKKKKKKKKKKKEPTSRQVAAVDVARAEERDQQAEASDEPETVEQSSDVNAMSDDQKIK